MLATRLQGGVADGGVFMTEVLWPGSALSAIPSCSTLVRISSVERRRWVAGWWRPVDSKEGRRWAADERRPDRNEQRRR